MVTGNRVALSADDHIPATSVSISLSSELPRIVFLNRSYWPDIEATGQLLTDLCRGLSSDFDVHVVCGQPNSPEPNCPFLEVGAEFRDGVTVHRLNHRKFEKKNPFGRILNLLSFYFACGKYLKQSEMSADIVISETDPFLLPIAGMKYADRIGAKHCIYLQDIYPDVAEAVGKVRLPMLARFLRHQLRRAYHRASRIIVLGRCMRTRLVDPPWSVAPEIIEIIPNWSDCERVVPIDHEDNPFREHLGIDDSFVVMHSGNMGLTQRLDVLIRAAKEPAWPKQAKLLLVGNGASRDLLLDLKEELDLPPGRVEFVHYQPRNRLAESLSAADVHIVSMHENIVGCLCPSKLYGIMAAGRPVIAIADTGTDLCQTVAERDLGWCVPPGSSSAIAEVVATAYREIGGNSAEAEQRLESFLLRMRSIALAEFDRPVVIRHFSDTLREVIAGTRMSFDEAANRDGVQHSDADDTSDIAVKL